MRLFCAPLARRRQGDVEMQNGADFIAELRGTQLPSGTPLLDWQSFEEKVLEMSPMCEQSDTGRKFRDLTRIGMQVESDSYTCEPIGEQHEESGEATEEENESDGSTVTGIVWSLDGTELVGSSTARASTLQPIAPPTTGSSIAIYEDELEEIDISEGSEVISGAAEHIKSSLGRSLLTKFGHLRRSVRRNRNG